MAETYGWVFVHNVPLLYEKRRVARQFQIEMWLDLTQLVQELGIEKLNQKKQNIESTLGYII